MYRMCMEDKIKQLIQQHKLAKQECWEQINELRKSDDNFSEVLSLETEYGMRNIFINDLENLI